MFISDVVTSISNITNSHFALTFFTACTGQSVSYTRPLQSKSPKPEPKLQPKPQPKPQKSPTQRVQSNTGSIWRPDGTADLSKIDIDDMDAIHLQIQKYYNPHYNCHTDSSRRDTDTEYVAAVSIYSNFIPDLTPNILD